MVSGQMAETAHLTDADTSLLAGLHLDGAVTDPTEDPDGVALAPGQDLVAYAVATGAVSATEHPGTPALTSPPYRTTSYSIRTLSPGSLPYVATDRPSTGPPSIHDANGVPMKVVAGKRYYAPAGASQYGLRMEDAYRRLHQAGYLKIADTVLRTLVATGIRSNGGIYVPYRFDFCLHHISTEVMHAPWYSAMAQGLLLSLSIRLYRDTKDVWYLDTAQSLFATFRHIGRGSAPWVTLIDNSRYYWLEEYPEPQGQSDDTLNGFIFAVFGLYDYYEGTHDPYGLQALRGALTTLRHYVSQYRIPGSSSRYCLEHGRPQIKYHQIVTSQLVFLYQMSGDSYFLSMSRQFSRDCA